MYAEYRLINMRAYAQTMLIRSIGLPLLYLSSMGLGLRTWSTPVRAASTGSATWCSWGPGLLVSSIVMEATGEFTFPVMSGFKWQKHYFAAAASPLTPAQIALGEVAAVGLRFIAETVIFWLALLLFGAVVSPASWLVVLIAPLAALAFGVPLLAFAATQTDEGTQFSFIQRLIVMPMFLFAGTFFSADGDVLVSAMGGLGLAHVARYAMPAWSATAWPNPWWLTVVHLAVLVGCTAGGVWAAIRVFTRRLRR